MTTSMRFSGRIARIIAVAISLACLGAMALSSFNPAEAAVVKSVQGDELTRPMDTDEYETLYSIDDASR